MRKLVGPFLLAWAFLGTAQPSAGNEPLWCQFNPKAKPTIKLLDPGAEPRSALRWKRVTGTREAGKVAVEDLHKSARGVLLEHRASASLTCLTEGVTRAGEATCRHVFDDFTWSTSSPIGAAPAEDLGTWAGATVRFTVNAQGVLKKFEPWKYPPAAKHVPALFGALQFLTDMEAPYFPSEAVGVGARWEVTGKPIAAYELHETTLCTLSERQEDRVRIEVTLTRTAKLERSPTEDGLTTTLKSYSATGTGAYDLDLALVLPLRASMTLTERLRKSMHLSRVDYGFDTDQTSTWSITVTGGRQEAATPR